MSGPHTRPARRVLGGIKLKYFGRQRIMRIAVSVRMFGVSDFGYEVRYESRKVYRGRENFGRLKETP